MLYRLIIIYTNSPSDQITHIRCVITRYLPNSSTITHCHYSSVIIHVTYILSISALCEM